MLETMWDSMSSSMQLAQEAMEKGDDDCAIGHSTAAVESFAQTIDNGKGFQQKKALAGVFIARFVSPQ